MIKKAPIKFLPYFKSVIWGGNKICRYKGISQTEPNIGECWEISALPGHESVVAEGAYKGMTITELVDAFGEDLLGKDVIGRSGSTFPLLIKLIDANDNLSVQVHPDDKLASERHGSLGKTEMWYIIQADNDAKIYAGLNTEMTPEDYVRRVSDGTFAETVAVHTSTAGDAFFIPAGRVHAIGAGNLLAEIQESSDITYRIYDYDRRDAAGNPRELHTEQAKDAIDYKVYEQYKIEKPDSEDPNVKLVECSHFTTHRIQLNGETELDLNYDSFTILMCLEGKVTVKYEDEEILLTPGTTVLLPAVMDTVSLSGNATLLLTHS